MGEHHERYAEIGEAWMQAYRVQLKKARTGLTGRAWSKTRTIEAPWPATSRKRLYILAHEIGHVALNHTRSLPRYVKEFEAEQFAHALMRKAGLVVPRDMTVRAKRYVSRCISKGIFAGAIWIDPDIADWASKDGAAGLNFKVPPGKARDYFTAAKRRVARALEPA